MKSYRVFYNPERQRFIILPEGEAVRFNIKLPLIGEFFHEPPGNEDGDDLLHEGINHVFFHHMQKLLNDKGVRDMRKVEFIMNSQVNPPYQPLPPVEEVDGPVVPQGDDEFIWYDEGMETMSFTFKPKDGNTSCVMQLACRMHPGSTMYMHPVCDDPKVTFDVISVVKDDMARVYTAIIAVNNLSRDTVVNWEQDAGFVSKIGPAVARVSWIGQGNVGPAMWYAAEKGTKVESTSLVRVGATASGGRAFVTLLAHAPDGVYSTPASNSGAKNVPWDGAYALRNRDPIIDGVYAQPNEYFGRLTLLGSPGPGKAHRYRFENNDATRPVSVNLFTGNLVKGSETLAIRYHLPAGRTDAYVMSTQWRSYGGVLADAKGHALSTDDPWRETVCAVYGSFVSNVTITLAAGQAVEFEMFNNVDDLLVCMGSVDKNVQGNLYQWDFRSRTNFLLNMQEVIGN